MPGAERIKKAFKCLEISNIMLRREAVYERLKGKKCRVSLQCVKGRGVQKAFAFSDGFDIPGIRRGKPGGARHTAL